MSRSSRPLLLLPVALALATPAAAQLTLRDALRQADAGGYANRIAEGTADAERARALAPLRGILPTARLDAGFVRTTDPVGAFGVTLRQRSVTPEAFAPARLNYPAPINNYVGGVVLEQPLFNADAWIGRRAARTAAQASGETATWTRLDTRTDVIRAYYGAVLAAERVATLDAATSAAHAHVAQAQSMVRQGLVTKSDALLASVRSGEVDAQLVEARGAARTARRQLAVLLGRDESGDVPATMPASGQIRREVERDTALAPAAERADVRAAEQGLDAARDDVRRARSTLLPRLNSFARFDWNSPSNVYGGDKNWTLGVMASWNLFSGGAEMSDVQVAAGRAAAARAGAEAAAAKARLEVEETRIALAVALQRLEIAEQAAGQSAEAHRIVTKRYGGGLATVAELLDAQATATGSALALSSARYGVITAAAERRQALGADPGTLAVLDDADRAIARVAPTAPATAAREAASPAIHAAGAAAAAARSEEKAP